MPVNTPKRTILVTGACGYVGRHVCTALLRNGVGVLAVDTRGPPPAPGVHFVSADFADVSPAWWQSCEKPDTCLHLAWSDGFNHNAQSHIDNIPKHAGFVAA